MNTKTNGRVRHFQCFPGERGKKPAHDKPYNIILADDHALFLCGIKRIIAETAGLNVVGEAGDGFQVLALLRKLTPDLVILDISMPKCGGLETAREIKRLYPGLKVMILTMHRDEEYLRLAMGLGVDGYMLKEAAADELIEAILALRAGRAYFSPKMPGCEAPNLMQGISGAREITW